MQSLPEFLHAIGNLLGSDWGRIMGTILSIASLGVSIWALKTTLFYKASFKAEHERFLESQWQDTYKLVLTNHDVATRVAKLFGRPVEGTKDEAAVLMFINILASSYNASRSRVISQDVHASHMRSLFDHLRGDPNALLERLKALGYDTDFLDECRRYIRA